MQLVQLRTRTLTETTRMYSLWNRIKKWPHRVLATRKSTSMNTIAWVWLLRKMTSKKSRSKHTSNLVHNSKLTDIYASFICSFALSFHRWVNTQLQMKMASERQQSQKSSWLRRMNSANQAWKTFWWKIINRNPFLTRMFQKVLGTRSQKRQNRVTLILLCKARCSKRNKVRKKVWPEDRV